MSQMPSVNAERAVENRAHVRLLLSLRQPAFAAALASAGQDFSCSACSGRRPEDTAFDAALATNIRAPYFLAAALAPAMTAKRSASIVNITT